MWQFGCSDIVEEPEEQEVLRPEWKHLLQRLEQGDELVVTKLSNHHVSSTMSLTTQFRKI
jgi:DNA invertase Pin-like site-specific DNA recombinase